MRIFISWSGDDSKLAAELMHPWLKNVIQEVDPWISGRDIPKGGKWQTSLGTSLSDTSFGLLMITRVNIDAPWLLFEAGALSNVSGSFVAPMLCGISELDLANTPLSQFQAVPVNKDGMLKLVFDINKQCSTPLGERQVTNTFEKWWPDFEKSYSSISFATKTSGGSEDKAPGKIFADALEDIIQSLRRIEQAVKFRPTFADVPQDRLWTALQGGLGIGPLSAAGLTSDEISRLAATLNSDAATKLARSMLTRKTGGRGMVAPEPISQSKNEGDKHSSTKSDEDKIGGD